MTITGLKIKLDRPVDRERPCCRNICIIGPGKGPHAGVLQCADCGNHRGWLSEPTAQWIEHVASRFGAPTTPIVVREFDAYDEEEAPAEEQQLQRWINSLPTKGRQPGTATTKNASRKDLLK